MHGIFKMRMHCVKTLRLRVLVTFADHHYLLSFLMSSRSMISVYIDISLHEGVTFSIHFLICTGSTLFTLVARRMRLGLAHSASANVCAFMIIYCAHVV